MPGCVGPQLIGVSVMQVVLDAPGLERVRQRRKHEGANDILQQAVFREGPVPAIMSHNKEAREGRPRQEPGHREQRRR